MSTYFYDKLVYMKSYILKYQKITYTGHCHTYNMLVFLENCIKCLNIRKIFLFPLCLPYCPLQYFIKIFMDNSIVTYTLDMSFALTICTFVTFS